VIPKWSFNWKFRMGRSVHVGPIFIAGNCMDSGASFLPPWLFVAALFAVVFNFIDIFNTLHSKVPREGYVYLLLAAICCATLAPFFSAKTLLDTRFWMHPIIKPLLATASLQTPIRIIVKGNNEDPIVINLRNFIKRIGHAPLEEHLEYERSDKGELHLIGSHITVLVIDSIASRDKYLNGEEQAFGNIMQNSVVVYSGADNPFGDGTEVASQLMRYLVLTKGECKDSLAKSIFSGIAIRAVKYLHHGSEHLV